MIMESHKHEEHKHTQHHVEHKPAELKSNYRIYLIAALVVLVLFNQWQISSLNNLSPSSGLSSGGSLQAISEIIPTGIPLVYGAEVGVSYDDISPTDQNRANNAIAKLSAYDKSMELTGSDLQRYIKIASEISCEYCCGANSIITANGQAACGCAHSYSMRGVAKYLIKYHPNEFTDDQILEELGKWKTLFFPGIMAQKAAVLKSKGIELNYINLASNKYRGIEKGVEVGSSGAMVGGC